MTRMRVLLLLYRFLASLVCLVGAAEERRVAGQFCIYFYANPEEDHIKFVKCLQALGQLFFLFIIIGR